MKTPRFEELARRWEGQADVYIVFSREAHPKARGFERLSGAADKLMAMDENGDNRVDLEEFDGPRQMFDPFDVNRDEVVSAHELLAATKIGQFEHVEDASTMAERVALARRYREECPGTIPVLIDGLDNATSDAYGRMPNSAFVIGTDGVVTHAFPWAIPRQLDEALAEVLGVQVAERERRPEPMWATIAEPLEAARASKRPLLLQFTAPGCGACEAMAAETFADAEVAKRLERYERATVGVEQDAHWALFEALDLSATPAFVVIGDGPNAERQIQGFQDVAAFSKFLDAR